MNYKYVFIFIKICFFSCGLFIKFIVFVSENYKKCFFNCFKVLFGMSFYWIVVLKEVNSVIIVFYSYVFFGF